MGLMGLMGFKRGFHGFHKFHGLQISCFFLGVPLFLTISYRVDSAPLFLH